MSDKAEKEDKLEEDLKRGILTYPDDRLITVCDPVDFEKDLQKLEELMPMMIEVCLAHRGWGLAANQLGYTKRFFLMSPPGRRPYFCFNPSIVRTGKDYVELIEGCLSAPGFMSKKMRYLIIDVEYINLDGKTIRETLKRREAQIFQHEMMHLNGEAFVEKPNLKND